MMAARFQDKPRPNSTRHWIGHGTRFLFPERRCILLLPENNMTWRAPAFIAATLALTIFPACSEDPPAPAVDRVGFPKDYRAAFRRLRSSENADAKTVIVVYGNMAAV